MTSLSRRMNMSQKKEKKLEALALDEPLDIPARANLLEDLTATGRSISYVRFHHPVPPYKDKEPVSEFRLMSKDTKYIVDAMLWTPHGVIFKANGEVGISSLANVVYCRLVI